MKWQLDPTRHFRFSLLMPYREGPLRVGINQENITVSSACGLHREMGAECRFP
jgi:hypothetical protein